MYWSIFEGGSGAAVERLLSGYEMLLSGCEAAVERLRSGCEAVAKRLRSGCEEAMLLR
jgi:hypothetical protein